MPKIEIVVGDGFSTTGGPHCVREPPNRCKSTKRNTKTKQQSRVAEEIKTNKYPLRIACRLWNSNLEVHEQSHIAGMSLPPMNLPKAPPRKIGNYEWFLTTIGPWEFPEQAVTDCAHERFEHNPKVIWVPNARLMSMKLRWGVLGTFRAMARASLRQRTELQISGCTKICVRCDGLNLGHPWQPEPTHP